MIVSSDGKNGNVLRAVSVEKSLEGTLVNIVPARGLFIHPDPLGTIAKIISIVLIVVGLEFHLLP